MDRAKATYGGLGERRKGRKAGSCIRIGLGGAAEGYAHTRAYWFTLKEAEGLRAELDAAIRRAKAEQTNCGPPEPPLAGAAALPRAA